MSFLRPWLRLFRIELDDQLLGDRQLDVFALRQLDDPAGEGLRREVEPRRDAARPGGFDRSLDLLVGAALLLDRDDLALREAEGVDDVVQPPLELREQVRSRDPLAALRPAERQAELVLQQAIDALDLLL